ncbi:MAG: 1,4-dihydroxy-2-naphthoate octaprenyltransferase [Crocinitomicaceae bacterium]|nr:1,4-dihydroxy-2-naphthoate octaprenyltransferase [Crocinitomicaceae bacterium]
MKKWLSAFRLRTLPLSLSTILMGGAIAHYAIPGSYYKWSVFILAILTTIFLQILSNLANDYGDFEKGTDNQDRIGPERAMQSGAISKSQMKKGLIAFVVLSLISGISLLFFAFQEMSITFIIWLLIGFGAIGAAIKYTMGTSAYGYRGLGDLFVFIFFGLVGVCGTYFVLTQSFNWLVLLPASAMGLLASAVLNLNNMRDCENDEKSGKNTLVVKLGIPNAKIYHYLLFVFAYGALAMFILMALNANIFFYVALVPFLLIHSIHLSKVAKIVNPKEFDPMLKIVALSTFGLSLVFSILLFVQ